MSRGHVLSLCDLTSAMVRPWLEAGYNATVVDLQRPSGTHTEHLPNGVTLTKEGVDIFRWKVPEREWVAVFAFPPCTDLAVSGARWWKDKGLSAIISALQLVERCRAICDESGAPYMIENPVGALSTHWRKPDHIFDPLDYGGYVLDGEAFTKRTCLWTGGGFRIPEKRPLPKSAAPNPIHWASPGPERANIRSATPRGFAQAVFEANQ